MIWPDPTRQPTHPPTHQIMHPPMGGGVSTDFKSSNRIEIFRLVQVLLNFEWFRGSPLGGGGVGGWGWGWWESAPHPHAHACACTCMCIWHHRESSGFPQIQWGQPFAWNYHVYHACMCVRVCACMCMHVHVCGGTPNHPPPPSTHPPTPKSCRKPKTPKFDNSWTNQDNSILFEDSLPLNIPKLI